MYSDESLNTDRFIRFVSHTPECFLRSHLAGHVTASAWVIDLNRDAVLLLHHKKLGRWMQPGGHCDGDSDTLNVARKELEEEAGLANASLAIDQIFDLDIHEIPSNDKAPAHLHYDVRYCFVAPREFQPVVSDESNDVRWVKLDILSSVTSEASIMRMAKKGASLRVF